MPGRLEHIPWSKPQGFEIDHRPTNGTGWNRIATSDGRWSHCDCYFQGPLLGYNGLAIRLLGKVGSIWVELVQTTIGAAPLLTQTPGFGSSTCIKWRGQPVMAFALEVHQVVGAILPLATWRMECWGEECCINTNPDGTLPIGPIIIPPAPPVVWTPFTSQGPAPGGLFLVSAVACIINGAWARNDSDDRIWFGIFDVNNPPPDGAFPVLPMIPVDPHEPAAFDVVALKLINGCMLVSSSTPQSYNGEDPAHWLDMGATVL